MQNGVRFGEIHAPMVTTKRREERRLVGGFGFPSCDGAKLRGVTQPEEYPRT
jgi:hypothetical protein